jgi:succinate dehydrogenase / fumarate reductase cytochrome b subunit
MVGSLTKENYFWHKIHSLTGIVPVGLYLLQHLLLNSFSLVSPEKYNGVSNFFYSLPPALLLAIEFGVVLLPLTFHAVYGAFIIKRAEPNYLSSNYKYTENRMYWLQRLSGIVLFVFILFHVVTTTGRVKLANDHHVVDYASMQADFSRFGGILTLVYAIGVLAAAYHLAYGIWNFCIRWGITVSEASQVKVRKFSTLLFIGVSILGLAALVGFHIHKVEPRHLEVKNSPSILANR